jgi:Uri superfamily endonuclease
MKGLYFLIIFVKENFNLKVGALNNVRFLKGIYIYVGSALGQIGASTLKNRVLRHLKSANHKKIHWHIDYLLKNEKAKIVKIYLLPTNYNHECLFAQKLQKNALMSIKNFGSSDCKCESHLFYFKNNKISLKSLVD